MPPLLFTIGLVSIMFGLEVDVGDSTAVSVGRAGDVCRGDDMAGGSPDADRLAEEVDDRGKWPESSGPIWRGSRNLEASIPT